MKVKDIMSKNIATLSSDDTIEKAAQLMKQRNVGSIPICSNQNVIGIVTDRDIALRSSANGGQAKNHKIGEIMSANPVVGNPEMDVHDAVKVMSDRQIRRLPIVDNNNLVGMVALGDISVQPNLQDNAEEALKNISKP